MEKIIYKSLINSDISRDEFALVINKEKNYFRLKKTIIAGGNRLKEHDNRI